MKVDIFGFENTKSLEKDRTEKLPKSTCLVDKSNKWEKLMQQLIADENNTSELASTVTSLEWLIPNQELAQSWEAFTLQSQESLLDEP